MTIRDRWPHITNNTFLTFANCATTQELYRWKVITIWTHTHAQMQFKVSAITDDLWVHRWCWHVIRKGEERIHCAIFVEYSVFDYRFENPIPNLSTTIIIKCVRCTFAVRRSDCPRMCPKKTSTVYTVASIKYLLFYNSHYTLHSHAIHTFVLIVRLNFQKNDKKALRWIKCWLIDRSVLSSSKSNRSIFSSHAIATIPNK